MKPGDLVRFFHPCYSHQEFMGVLIRIELNIKEPGTIRSILDFDGRIIRIPSSILPEHEVISEAR